jgi:hypothetical protein
MSPTERAVLDAAKGWVEARQAGPHRAALAEAEAALRRAVRLWLSETARATDEAYAEQTVERAIESTSAASTTDRAEAVEQLTGSRSREG